MVRNNQRMQWEGSRRKCRGPDGDGKTVIHCTREERIGLPVLTETPATCALLPNSGMNALPSAQRNTEVTAVEVET